MPADRLTNDQMRDIRKQFDLDAKVIQFAPIRKYLEKQAALAAFMEDLSEAVSIEQQLRASLEQLES